MSFTLGAMRSNCEFVVHTSSFFFSPLSPLSLLPAPTMHPPRLLLQNVFMAAMISSISSFSASSLLRQRMGWQTARTRAAHHRQPLQPITHQLLVSLLEKQSVQSSLGKRYPFTAIHQRTILSTSLRLSSSDTHTDASSTTTTTYGSSAVRSMRPTTNTTDLSNTKLQLLSFYRFIPISQPESVRDVLFERLKEIDGLTGTVYIAEEGINAQFSRSETRS